MIPLGFHDLRRAAINAEDRRYRRLRLLVIILTGVLFTLLAFMAGRVLYYLTH